VTILDWISQEYIPQLLDSFLNPQKRVSIYYLALAASIALCWSFFVARRGLRNSFKHTRFYLFSRNIWFSRSALADYKILLANHALLILIAPFFISKLLVATVLFFALQDLIPAGGAILSNVSPLSVAIGYTLFLFLLDDFSRFATHFALHRIPALWAFHKIHHSAETLSPLTVYRTHPVEAIIFSFRSIAVQSISISLVVFLFGSSVDLISVYGVNAILFVFNVTGSNLRHSHIQIRYGRRIERFLISPAQHQIHHSLDPRHHDRNFGAALAIWDWMAGSLYIARRNMKLDFGLTKNQTAQTHLLSSLYLSPFYEVFKSIRMAITRHNPSNRSAKKHAI
tara:strand:- start:20891 stop:21910 length:1020 start_codon:yes stop_codon:yes gene_type:complete